MSSIEGLCQFKLAYASGQYRECLNLFDSFYKEWKKVLSKETLEVVFAIIREIDPPKPLF